VADGETVGDTASYLPPSSEAGELDDRPGEVSSFFLPKTFERKDGIVAELSISHQFTCFIDEYMWYSLLSTRLRDAVVV
jgi:hypothetical protein